jgi:hypothetical protein
MSGEALAATGAKRDLLSLPPEVLDGCTSCLSGISVARLWLCGNRSLQKKMREGGVTALAFNFHDLKQSPERLPSFCPFLAKLTSFSWFLSSTHSTSAISIRMFDCLPKTLRSLRVNRRLDFPEPSPEKKPFMDALSEMFPALQSIEATRLGEGSHSIVPSTITSIAVTTADRLHFPSSLTSLSVQDVGPVIFSSWIAFHSSYKLPAAVSDFFQDPELCANLTTFSLHFSTGDFLSVPESWDILPRSLTHLRLCATFQPTDAHFLHLPIGLRFFAFSSEVEHFAIQYDAKSISALPPKLTYLELMDQQTAPELAKIVPSDVSLLPRTLQTLVLSFEFDPHVQDPINYEPCVWNRVNFPPSLHTLQSMSSLRGANLPPTITDLCYRLNANDFGQPLVLPSKLVILEIHLQSIAPSDLHAIENLSQLLVLRVTAKTKILLAPQGPFWPRKALVHLEIRENKMNLDYIDTIVSDEALAAEWLEAIPPAVHTLALVHPHLCPIFSTKQRITCAAPVSLPSSITKLEIMAQSAHFLACLPRKIRDLSFCSLEPIDPQCFHLLPPQVECAHFYGLCNELVRDHIGLLPPKLSKIRLMLPSIPDIVKATAMAAEIHILHSRVPARD